MHCYYTNVGAVQDITRLVERVERLSPCSVHLVESTKSHFLRQFFTRDRYGSVQHQRGAALQFSRAVSILEWLKSDRYDIIGAVVQKQGSLFIHLTGYRTPNPQNHDGTKKFKNIPWRKEFVTEYCAHYTKLLALATAHGVVEGAFCSGDLNMNFNGNCTGEFRRFFEHRGFVNMMPFWTHSSGSSKSRIDFLYYMGKSPYRYTKVEKVEKRGTSGHTGVIVSPRDVPVTREVTYVDTSKYVLKIGEFSREVDMTNGDSTELLAKFHDLLTRARTESLETRTVENKPKWLFTTQLIKHFDKDLNWTASTMQTVMDLFYDAHDYRKSYFQFMECVLNGRNSKQQQIATVTQIKAFAGKQSAKNSKVPRGTEPEWVYENYEVANSGEEQVLEEFEYEEIHSRIPTVRDNRSQKVNILDGKRVVLTCCMKYRFKKLIEKMSDSTAIQYGVHLSNKLVADSDVLQDLIYPVFVKMIATCDIPAILKRSRVAPVPKPMKQFEDYRPVCVFDVIRKILEYFLGCELKPYYGRLLPTNLMAYRSMRSTFLCMVLLDSFTADARYEGKMVFFLFRDVSGAYESIDHQHLLCQLEEFGVPRRYLQLIWEYLQEQSQCVVHEGEDYEIETPEGGCSQGGPLSAEFWNIAFAVLHSNAKYRERHLTYNAL